MREILVGDLVREVLGPRHKKNSDIMKNDPYDEFITGMLEPIRRDGGTRDMSHQDYDDDPGTSTSKHEEIHELDDQDMELSHILSPPLDPQKRASTMGMTFSVKSPASIDLSICLTWARYMRPEPETHGWQRFPRGVVLDHRVELEPAQNRYDTEMPVDRYVGERQHETPEIALKTFVKRTGEMEYMVSIFLINRMDDDTKGRTATEFCIFQPQIRINHSNQTEIVPLASGRSKDEYTDTDDDGILAYLHRKERVFARGHLVSAIWRDMDPEGAEPATLDNPESINGPPFKWVDQDLIPEESRDSFSPPEIRTEYAPLYQVPMPDVDWDSGLDTMPELSAEKLSEMWDGNELKSALYPIYGQYMDWINKIESDDDNDARHTKLVKECRNAARRIHDGIDMLTNPNNDLYDRDIVLSFCFANKVMSLPSTWPRNADGKHFQYRPFQMAFLLMCLESVVNPKSEFRNVCDLMWVPTGTGKTEAYLALAAFIFAYRRRLALRSNDEKTGAGVSILTRYTLRLLTIQQFRRTLSIVTAAEFLRISNDSDGLPNGWRPEGYPDESRLIWGSTPFSIGLWIGSSMTPNSFEKKWFANGAWNLLSDPATVTFDNTADPAQVIECPACGKNGILAISKQGMEANVSHRLHFVIKGKHDEGIKEKVLEFIRNYDPIRISDPAYTIHSDREFFTLSLSIESEGPMEDHHIVDMWENLNKEELFKLCPASAARPGYFFNKYIGNNNKPRDFDFEIFCPNPECVLKTTWCGGLPQGRMHGIKAKSYSPVYETNGIKFVDNNAFMHILEPFRKGDPFLADRIPINAFTADYQVYQRAPTVLISTSDKFARPPYAPEAAAIFGNVDHHHTKEGYYRLQLDDTPKDGMKIPALRRPDLILQDELHLADGPLGSMMGIYESALDALCSGTHPVKYIASTATIRNATDHVKALFNRNLQIFPPHGSDIHDRFFVRTKKRSILDDSKPGRLYLGMCAVGRGPLTPLIRIWARLAQSAWEHNDDPDKIDPYWTMTGYFNAIRELAGAISLYRQDIPERLKILSDHTRELDDNKSEELSGRTESMKLPGILDILAKKYDKSDTTKCPDALFTTSMFGTGIDISRLGLMLVNGQPKTVSSYIQATGRVGRQKGGLILTFYRAARARDLNHYEFFSRHHSQLHRFVESPTIYPFSETLLHRTLGPLLVFLLRNMRDTDIDWGSKDSALYMSSEHLNRDVSRAIEIMGKRAESQPHTKKLAKNTRRMVQKYMEERSEEWMDVAKRLNNKKPRQALEYVQYNVQNMDKLKSVVLGDSRHNHHPKISVVYPNAPQSLRAVEEETAFGA